MDHEYYKDRVSAYVDGALPAYEQMALEEHIAQCAECRALLEKLRKLEAMVQETSALGESDYWEQQAQKIEARLGLVQTEVTRIGPARSWRGLGWKLTAAAASIVVVGVIGFYSWESIREKTDRPPAQMAPSLPPASVIMPQKIQPLQENADEANKAESLSKQKIVDTENYKRPAVVERSKPGGTIVKYETSGQVSILKAKANSAAAPVEPVPDGQIKVISVPEPVQPTESTPREVARVALKSVAAGAQSDTAMQGEMQKDSPALAAVQGLGYWRAIRDSLGDMGYVQSAKRLARQKLTVDSANISLQNRTFTNDDYALSKVMTTSEQKSVIREMLRADSLRLRAYYSIARLSTDTAEVSIVLSLLQSASTHQGSVLQSLARAYLDSLGVK